MRNLLLVWVSLQLLCQPLQAQAKRSICKRLSRNAAQFYQKAIRWNPTTSTTHKRTRPHCLNKQAGWHATALYRAALVYRCPNQTTIFYRLGTLYQSCSQERRLSCHFYGRFLHATKRQTRHTKTTQHQQTSVSRILPFQIKEAHTDQDRDGFRSCQSKRIICSTQAKILITTNKQPRAKQRLAPLCDCDDTNPKSHPDAKEVCDGIDNNCNGKIDEIPKRFAPLCAKQEGVCHGTRKQCGGKRGWLPCTHRDYKRANAAYQQRETTCDGADNDCDGLADNNLKAPLCKSQKGACKGSRKTCMGLDGWSSCSIDDFKRNNKSFHPEELCDGVDNDCDGKVDNIPYPPPCTLRDGVCHGLLKACQGKKGWKDCTTERYKRHSKHFQQLEIKCDGIDNDCDGKTDETCTNTLPWIIAGTGLFLAATGIILRSSLTPDPFFIADQERDKRPGIGHIRGYLTFADIMTITGASLAVASAGTGMILYFQAHTHRQPALLHQKQPSQRKQP